ncbi:MAG: hypothetical protein GY773_21850 [Actinomycetia bacterium]|nr:hypothetical protein [Actinomycetes bacterium]MCP5035615.1 hypothetical protein [Actinomycetes bacterium]
MTDKTGEPETPGGSEDDLLSQVEQLREQNDELRRELASASQTRATGWRRRWLSISCAVLGGIFLPLAVITLWARDTMLDTDEYVSTVAPLAEDDEVRAAVSSRVTEAVAEAADFRGIAEATLPEDAQILAGPIEAGAKSLIAETVDHILATPEFTELWEDANRVAHENLAALITGEGNDLVATDDGRVVVKLGPVAQDVVQRLDDGLGTELTSQIPPEQLDAEMVLVESEELADIQDQVGWFNSLSWFSLVLALGFLIGAVALAEQRRLGARRLGLAVILPTLLALLSYAWARDQYISGLPDDLANPKAATAIFDILTRFLPQTFRALLVVGVLVLVGTWVAGPSPSAARVRGAWDMLLGRARESGTGREAGPVIQGIAAHERALLTLTASLGGLALVWWTHPTGMVVLLVAATTVVAAAGVRLVAEVGRRSEPSSDDAPSPATGEPAVAASSRRSPG